MATCYVESLSEASRSRYLAKLKAIGVELCPFTIDDGAWLNNPTEWPAVQYADVYNYLIESPSAFSKEKMKNYRSLEAYNFFQSGWVHDVQHITTSTGNVVLKASVRRSQRVTEKPHHAWVAVDSNGVVLAAHCTCMAGIGESCSHVAAILFKVEAAVRLGYTSTACTDVACKWNASFVQKVQPAPIINIGLSRKGRAEQLSIRLATLTTAIDNVTTEQDEFFLQLATISQPVCLSLFDSTCETFQASLPEPDSEPSLPQSLRSLYQPPLCTASEADISKYCETINISITQSEVDFVEKSTVLQAKSVTWHEQRAGRITASVAHKVMRTDLSNPAKSLILGITSGSTKELNVPSVIHGRQNEPVAINLFKEKLPQLHKDAEIKQTGFRLCMENPWLGASPDGIIRCSCHGEGVLEVKCPYSLRDLSLSDMIQHPECCLTPDGVLKKSHPYYTQLQVQMYVLQVQYGILLLFTQTLAVCSVERDSVFLQSCVGQLQSFWQTHVVRELVTRKLELYGNNPPSSIPVVCYCHKPKGVQGELMVKCSGSNCPFGGLIHLSCIRPKRKYPPKATWWCRTCRKYK